MSTSRGAKVPEALQRRAREWALTLWAQKAVAVPWSVATVSAVKSHERTRWDGTIGRSIVVYVSIQIAAE